MATKHFSRNRFAAVLSALALLVTICAACGGSSHRSAAPGVPLGPSGAAFYEPPSPLPHAPNGRLIRAQPIPAPTHSEAWKVLYLSSLGSAQQVATSGLVVTPTGPAPKGGRPVVGWAHGTTGVARSCAPSAVTDPAQDLVDYFSYQSVYPIDVGIPALTSFLAAGDVVVATDYQGLGTPGPHQYSVGATEAHNILDAVKAAEQIPAAHAGQRAVVLGWSQGGGAAIFTNQDAAYGAPVQILGSAALAPNADLGPQFAGKVPPGPTTATSPGHDAALRITFYAGMLAAYHQLSPSQVLAASGIAALRGAYTQCVEQFADVIETNSADPGSLFRPGPTPDNWQTIINDNTVGEVSTTAPVLVMQGTADSVIDPNATTDYVNRACQYSQPIDYAVYPGATHQTVPTVAQAQYTAWIADRFAGHPAPSTCPPKAS